MSACSIAAAPGGAPWWSIGDRHTSGSAQRDSWGVRPGNPGVGFPRERTVLFVPMEHTWAEGPGHTAPRPGLWKSEPGVNGETALEAAARCPGSQTGPLVVLPVVGLGRCRFLGPGSSPGISRGDTLAPALSALSRRRDIYSGFTSCRAPQARRSELTRALSVPSPSSLILSIGQLKARK